MKNIRKSFMKFLSDKTKKRNYPQIRDRIDFNEIISEDPIKQPHNAFLSTKIIYLGLTIFILAISVTWILIPKNDTRFIYGDLLYNPSDINEVVSNFDYIFVARIDSYISTQQYDGIGTDIPYTFYHVDDIDYLKGEGTEIADLAFYGGTNWLNRLIMFNGVEELPSVDSYYLILSNKTSSDNGRIQEGTYVVANGTSQMILLENYDANLTLDNQNETILNLIQPYKEMIDFYDVINQLGLYEEPENLIFDLENTAHEINQSNDSFVDFTSLTYIDTINISENYFVLFQFGPIVNGNFNLFLLELELDNGNWSVYKTSADIPIFFHKAVYSSINYNNNSEFSFDNQEVFISINDKTYSLGFSVLKLTSNQVVLYNGQYSEKTEVGFVYNNEQYSFYFCYAISDSVAERSFELING